MGNDGTLPELLQSYVNKLGELEHARSTAKEQLNNDFLDQGPVLYHYTNAQGLQGILRDRAIWFTDYRHLNDPSELHFGADTISDVINRIPVGSNLNARHFLEAIASMLEVGLRQFEYFIASFSTDGDQLGQWRAYADNGRGFAIGFAPRMFRSSPTATLPELFLPVSYGMEPAMTNHSEPLQGALDVFLDAVDEHRELLDDDSHREAMINEMGKSLLASSLILNCLTSKHAAYEHEREVRLVVAGRRETLRSLIKTRIRTSEIVPYIPVEKPELLNPNVITSIVIGPAAPPDSERTIKTMLREYGYPEDIFVTRSDIPYRPPA